jgi:GAF domain-containing protein
MAEARSLDEILADYAAKDSGPEPHESRLDPAEALAELAKIDLRTDDLQSVLQRVAELAKKTLPGVDEVSVTLIGGKGPGVSPAYTGELAIDADESQYSTGAGPCVDAAQGGEPVRIDDVTTEQRWPEYIPHAREIGVGSSLSLPLPVQEAVTGALNLYARAPHAFDEQTYELASAFAGYAAVAVANSQLYETTAALARQMQDAMQSRAVIEQAKGLIMGAQRCSSDEAFDILVGMSSRSNRKLRDVATEIVASVQRRGQA